MFVACIWRRLILGKCYMWRRLKAVAPVTLKWNLYGIKLIATLFLQKIFMLFWKIKYIHVQVENMRFLSDRCFSSTLWHLFLGFIVQKKRSRGWKASPTRHAFTLRFCAFFFSIYAGFHPCRFSHIFSWWRFSPLSHLFVFILKLFHSGDSEQL